MLKLTFSSLFGLFCAKFQPDEKGKERLEIARKIAKKKGIDISDTLLKKNFLIR